MAQDMVADAGVETSADVMASVESEPTETFVIADVSRDGAYLTMALEDAATLPGWR
jgi:hypothetical protein